MLHRDTVICHLLVSNNSSWMLSVPVGWFTVDRTTDHTAPTEGRWAASIRITHVRPFGFMSSLLRTYPTYILIHSGNEMHIRLFITALSKSTKGETKPNIPYEGLVKLTRHIHTRGTYAVMKKKGVGSLRELHKCIITMCCIPETNIIFSVNYNWKIILI